MLTLGDENNIFSSNCCSSSLSFVSFSNDINWLATLCSACSRFGADMISCRKSTVNFFNCWSSSKSYKQRLRRWNRDRQLDFVCHRNVRTAHKIRTCACLETQCLRTLRTLIVAAVDKMESLRLNLSRKLLTRDDVSWISSRWGDISRGLLDADVAIAKAAAVAEVLLLWYTGERIAVQWYTWNGTRLGCYSLTSTYLLLDCLDDVITTPALLAGFRGLSCCTLDLCDTVRELSGPLSSSLIPACDFRGLKKFCRVQIVFNRYSGLFQRFKNRRGSKSLLCRTKPREDLSILDWVHYGDMLLMLFPLFTLKIR